MENQDDETPDPSWEKARAYLLKQAEKTPNFKGMSLKEAGNVMCRHLEEKKREDLLSSVENGVELLKQSERADKITPVAEKISAHILDLYDELYPYLQKGVAAQQEVSDHFEDLTQVPETNLVFEKMRLEFQGFEPDWFHDDEKFVQIKEAWERHLLGPLQDQTDINEAMAQYHMTTENQKSFYIAMLNGLDKEELSIAEEKGEAAIDYMEKATERRAASLYQSLTLSDKLAKNIGAETIRETLKELRSELNAIVPDRPELSAQNLICPAALFPMR